MNAVSSAGAHALPAAGGDAVPTPAANREWWLWRDRARPPALNMAVDEALLHALPSFDRPLLRIYDWDRPAITIGYFQHVAAVADEARPVIRRCTGGGAVWHGDDLTYTVAVPAHHPLFHLPRRQSYRVIGSLIVDAVRSLGAECRRSTTEIPASVNRRRMRCFDVPTRYDIVGAAGKVGGAAQRRTAHGFIHQGSIDPARLDLTRNAVIDALAGRLRVAHGWQPLPADVVSEVLAAAADLRERTYATTAWNHRL